MYVIYYYYLRVFSTDIKFSQVVERVDSSELALIPTSLNYSDFVICSCIVETVLDNEIRPMSSIGLDFI